MWSPVELTTGKSYPYGFGWDVTEVNGHRLIDRGGAWQGSTTQIYNSALTPIPSKAP
jgi:hypothetical protein